MKSLIFPMFHRDGITTRDLKPSDLASLKTTRQRKCKGRLNWRKNSSTGTPINRRSQQSTAGTNGHNPATWNLVISTAMGFPKR